jgi:hypothetical protein
MKERFEVYDLYDQMERKNIMLSFKGELNTELLNSILNVVEEKLAGFDENAVTRKKVFNVLVELLQNLYHHKGSSPILPPSKTGNESSVIIMIARNATGYSIITGNFINNQNVARLQKRLEEINSMSKEDLKTMYKTVLNNGVISSKGGGGLGMIDIARKAGDKLDYGFIPFDDENTFFSLNVKVV